MDALSIWPTAFHNSAHEYLLDMRHRMPADGRLPPETVHEICQLMSVENPELANAIIVCLQHFANWHMLGRRFYGTRTDISKSRRSLDVIPRHIDHILNEIERLSSLERSNLIQQLQIARPERTPSGFGGLGIEVDLQDLRDAIVLAKPAPKRGNREDYVLNFTVTALSQFFELLEPLRVPAHKRPKRNYFSRERRAKIICAFLAAVEPENRRRYTANYICGLIKKMGNRPESSREAFSCMLALGAPPIEKAYREAA